MAHLLGLQQVGITLGSRPILGDISVDLEDGVRIGVVGPNGGGKTTLLRLMTGAVSPDTGIAWRWRQPYARMPIW